MPAPADSAAPASRAASDRLHGGCRQHRCVGGPVGVEPPCGKTQRTPGTVRAHAFERVSEIASQRPSARDADGRDQHFRIQRVCTAHRRVSTRARHCDQPTPLQSRQRAHVDELFEHDELERFRKRNDLDRVTFRRVETAEVQRDQVDPTLTETRRLAQPPRAVLGREGATFERAAYELACVQRLPSLVDAIQRRAA